LVETTIERKAAAKLRNLLAANFALNSEVRNLLALGEAVVFGGWVRDTLHSILHGEVPLTRDFDIVVHGSLLPRADGETNHFGGRRLSLPERLSIDCWELSRTLAFTRGLLVPSFPNLLRSTVYRLNACFIDLRDFRLQSEGALEDIRERRISFNCKGYLDVYPEYQAFRAIDLQDRLGYALDDEVTRFVADTLREAGPQRFASEVREHRRHESAERLDRLFRTYSG
jgi:hypothetical protein